ncbi:MAG: multidrug ABC transporter ATP-binding protein [Rhodospirillaceae bacterium]|jgi:ABC-2 type transport system ATP-binding protein|nr:multidrug ABC transporter ATP-binding protein [Rhodospirillaceae bacterium]|tara:strand:- start:142 stop:1155 length:1014 start_codon:yes stop_codon:yes gene_type:complete
MPSDKPAAAPDGAPEFAPELALEFAVETVGLSKTYAAAGDGPGTAALKEVSLRIPRGSFFGLLGPNGAGKSTLINILAGLVIKTSGEARVCGHDIEKDMRQARLSIGVVPQELNIDPFFTPRELLELQAGFYGLRKSERRTTEVLDAVGLADKADAYARSLSGGMRRRLLVAKAMVHSPPVLILDEPSAGVDVDLRRQIWARVGEMNRRGTTILLTTHYLEEAQALCDTIAIIDHGRLIASEPTESLLRRIDAKEMTVTLDREITEVPAGLKPYNVEFKTGRRLKFSYPPSKTHSGEILDALAAAGLGVVDLTTREADLEDIFLNLTGGTERDGDDE